MRKRLTGLALAALLSSGCASTSYTSGTDFNSANVSRIQHGYTTTADLRRLFGEPYKREPVGASLTKWVYVYQSGTASAGFFSNKVESSNTQKLLEVLVQGDTVINHTYSHGTTPTTVITR